MPKKVSKAVGRLEREQAEQDMVRKKEEILTLFLKDKLQKEERNSLVNRQKLTVVWQTLARQTRSEELHDDIITLQQGTDRQLDHLDSIIKGLERELQEAERQVACGRRLHLQNLERLRQLLDECVATVQRRWESCLETMQSRFLSERSHIVTQCLLKEADWEDVRFALDQKHQAEKAELHQLYGESMAVLEVARQEQAAVLAQSNFEMVNDKSCQNQEAKQQQDSESKGPERKGQRNMKNTCKKKLKTEVSDLQQKIQSIELENSILTEKLSAVNHHVPVLRQRLVQNRQTAQKKLKELAVVSDSVSRRLKSAIAMGEKVLSVLESCEKLQPEAESTTAQLGQTDVELQGLRRRHHQVVLRKEVLQKQRDALRQENQELRTLLRQRLDSMTVSHGPLDGHLLVIGAAPTTTTPAHPDRRHTVIEAAHAIRHTL